MRDFAQGKRFLRIGIAAVWFISRRSFCRLGDDAPNALDEPAGAGERRLRSR